MRKLWMAAVATLAIATLTIAGMAEAHGPSRLKTDQQVTLNAPPDQVWAVIGDFGDMSWYPGVTSVEATGNEKGATRTRTMADGQVVKEELIKIDPAKYAISIRFTEDNIAVVKATNYASHITLKEDGGKTVLDWKGAFYRGFPQNEPPDELNDDASTASVLEVQQKGIDALVERFGAAQ